MHLFIYYNTVTPLDNRALFTSGCFCLSVVDNSTTWVGAQLLNLAHTVRMGQRRLNWAIQGPKQQSNNPEKSSKVRLYRDSIHSACRQRQLMLDLENVLADHQLNNWLRSTIIVVHNSAILKYMAYLYHADKIGINYRVSSCIDPLIYSIYICNIKTQALKWSI